MKKMKKMKKFLAVILSLSMILGMSITSFAAEGGNAETDNKIGTSDDTATITVKNVDSATSVTAYPFIQATYGKNNNTSDFKGYEVLGEFASVSPAIKATKKNDNTLEYTLTQSQISQIRSNLTAKSKKYIMTETRREDGKGTGTYTANVPIGAYLVVVEGSNTSTYNAMVVSTYYKTEEVGGETENIIEMEKAAAEAKKSTEPSLDKTITGLNGGKEVNGGEKGNSVNLGDVLTYTVTIENIPSYTGAYPVFNVTDTLSSGLEYVANSLEVSAGTTKLAAETYYTLTTPTADNGKKLSLDFVKKGYADSMDQKPENDYTLEKYKNEKLTLTYQVKVTNAALLNEAGNKNDVKLQFTKDSSVNSEDVKKEKEDQTYTYSFEVDGSITETYSEGKEDNITYVSTKYILNKIGEEVAKEQIVKGEKTKYSEDLKQALGGAEFHLYTDEDCTVEYTNAKAKSNKTAYGVITSDSEGQLKLTGLAAGTYYLKETKAPAGYTVNRTPVKIEITANYYRNETTIGEGATAITKNPGQLESWSVKVNDRDVATFSISNTEDNIGKWTRTDTIVKKDPTTVYTKEGYDILNTKITELPSTGGVGTTIFTIAGCAIMVAAAGFFFMNRKKSAK